MVIGVISYPSMPEMLAVHYGAKGVPNRLAAKSVATAFSLVFVQISVTALLGLVAMIDVGMLGSSLLMWTGTVTSWAPLVIVLPILAAVMVAVVILARNNRERDEGEEDTGLTHRDDDKYWRGGLFYVNREDHALLVPRRFGLGWTLNFGNPRTAMLLAGVVALTGLLITLRFGG